MQVHNPGYEYMFWDAFRSLKMLEEFFPHLVGGDAAGSINNGSNDLETTPARMPGLFAWVPHEREAWEPAPHTAVPVFPFRTGRWLHF